MATIASDTGSIHRGQLERRRQQLTVTGAPAGPVWLTWGRVELARGVVGQPLEVDVTALPLGPAQVVARWATGSDTKSTTVVPDPQPGPTNTGPRVPAAELEPFTSAAVIRASTTLEGVLRETPLVVRGAGVVLTVRRSLIRCGTVSGELVVDCREGARVVFEDSDLDGLGTARIGLGYAGVTVRRSNVHHCNDGLRLASNSLLEDSWVHDLTRIVAGGQVQHPDCVQITGGDSIDVRHNTLDCREADGGLGNACIQVNREKPVTGVTIADNWVDGGNYTINVVAAVDEPPVLTGNRYGGHWRYGPLLAPAGVKPVGDVVAATGAAVNVVRAR